MIGEKFATRNELEILQRKLDRLLHSATIVQHESDTEDAAEALTDLTDGPGAYTAAGNFVTRVKGTLDGFEFVALLGTSNQVTVTANAADYTLSLPQDIHTGASPTFVTVKLSGLTDGYVPYHVADATGLANSPIRTDGTLVGVGMLPTTAQLEVNTSQIITSTTAAPYLQIINASDTERDPVVQYGVGATPVIRWTHGIDDSLSNDWLLCTGETLTTTAITETYTLDVEYDDYLFVADYENDRIKRHMRADLTYSAKTGTSGSGDNNFNGPYGITSNGTHVYVTDYFNNRIKKHLISDMSYVSQIGSVGSGNDNFNNPKGIATDGTWLYIADYDNNRVQKRLCSDLSYVTEATGNGINRPTAVCTDGTYVYMVQNPGATYRIYKFLAADMSLVLRVMPAGTDGQLDNCAVMAVCTTGGYLYMSNCNSVGTGAIKAVYKYACSDLTYVSKFGDGGSGDGQFTQAWGIATDDTYLYVSDDSGTDFVNPQRIQKLLLDGTFVSKFGTYGNGDDNFHHIHGLSVSGVIDILVTVPKGGPILRADHDATWLDVYPLLRARDGFRLMEDGTVDATKYVGHFAPSSITASYDLTWPAAAAGAKKHLYTSSGNQLAWGQNVDTDGSPTFANITDSGLTATHPVFTDANKLLVSTGTVPVDHGGTGLASYAVGDLLYASAGTTLSKLADVAVGSYLRSGGVTTAPLWSTLILPNAATAYRLVVATAADTIGELAAVGATGQYLKGNTGAIPSWGNISEFEPALGNPGTSGWVLSSTDAGVRSWIPAGGALALDDLTDVDAASPNDDDIIRFDTATGLWKHEALPAGGAHDLLSATHSDTTASAVVRGDIIVGSGATPKWTALAKGTEGYVLTMGANEPAWVASTAGAPTAAKYIVGLAHADLSAEKVKPQLYNNYDIDDTPAAPNALDDEFDNSSLDAKWTITNAPATRNFDETTYPGFLSAVIPETAVADVFGNYHRIHQTPPATGNFAMEFIAKVCLDMVFDSTSTEVGEWADVSLYLGESTHSKWVASVLQTQDAAPSGVNTRQQGAGFHDNGAGVPTYMTSIVQMIDLAGRWVYLKLKKEGTAAYTSANTYSAWISLNGLAWQLVGSCSHTFDHDCDEVGIMCRPPKAQTGAPTSGPFIDFFRRTV